jgi:hypothetical protein
MRFHYGTLVCHNRNDIVIQVSMGGASNFGLARVAALPRAVLSLAAPGTVLVLLLQKFDGKGRSAFVKSAGHPRKWR